MSSKKFILVPTPDGTDQLIKVSQISRVIQDGTVSMLTLTNGEDFIYISITPAEVLALIQGCQQTPDLEHSGKVINYSREEIKAKQMRADMAEDLEEPKLSRGGFNEFVEHYRVLAGKEDLTMISPGNVTAEEMSAWLYCVLNFCTVLTEWGSDLELTIEAAARGHFANATIYPDHVMLRRYDGKLIRQDVRWSKYQKS